MSGDCRIDVSPDGKHLLLGIEMGEEANRRKLGWAGAGVVVLRSPFTARRQNHSEKTVRLGWRLDR